MVAMVLTSATAMRPQQRRSPALLAAFVSAVAFAVPAAAQERGATAVSPPPIEDTPLGRAGGAAPGGADPARAFPQVSFDVDMNLYAIGTPAASGRRREGFSGFLFGHINPGLHLTPDFSVQAFVHPDPAGDFEPNGAVTVFRRQNVILEQLFAEWRPVEGLQLYAGKFNAPFGYGYEFFPGVLASFRAHDVYLVREQLGGGANWRLPFPEGWGGHTLAAAVFTLDTTFLSNSLVTRRRCDGTRLEWAWAAGLRHEHAWTGAVRTLAFAEFVEFRNSGGSPLEEDAGGGEGVVSERWRFSTLGAQAVVGPWRATLVWQRDAAKRSFNPLPTQNYYEASVGHDLSRSFGLDVGYQHARIVRDDRSPGSSHSVVARLNHRFTR